MLTRRHLLLAPTAVFVNPVTQAAQRNSLADPLRVGVDTSIFDSGLATALQRGFGRDTGVAVQLVRNPATTLLQALQNGELDALLNNAPAAEALVEKQGLLHDRRLVATTEFVIVGPAAALHQTNQSVNALDVLRRIQAVGAATPSAATFLSAADGSGLHLTEQALWRAAGVAPKGIWYVSTDAATLLAQTRQQSAYTLVERGVWMAQGGKPLVVVAQNAPVLVGQVHVMRGFHHKHPAGKLFISWITGPKGQRVVHGHKGYV
jgi:tungstate transport system substrate-binding protein